MGCNDFWSAFGAIGTSLGSLITAGAVVVAVKQYKQPITKLIKVEFHTSIAKDMNNNLIVLYAFSIKNRGVRPVTINALYVKGKKHNLFINPIQAKYIEYKTFPTLVEPETCVNYYFEAKTFRTELMKMVKDNYLKKGQKLVVFAQDTLGDEYYCKTHTKIKKL